MFFRSSKAKLKAAAVMVAAMITASAALAAGQGSVTHNVEYDDGWRGVTMEKELVKALATRHKEMMLKNLKIQYQQNGFALKYVPEVRAESSLLSVGDKNLASVKITLVYSPEEQAEDMHVSIVLGIDDDELHKVMCLGVSNPLADKDCLDMVESAYGDIMLTL